MILLVSLGVYWFWLKGNSAGSNENISSNHFESTKTDEENSESENSDTQTSSEETIPVPNLNGRNYKNLQKELEKSGKYKVVLLSEEYHD